MPEHDDVQSAESAVDTESMSPPSERIIGAPALAAPVAQSERIQSIDVLRGFALLGILVMNMQSFAMLDSAYFLPNTAQVDDFTGINFVIWYLGDLLADQKFMSIFSMLFGAGVVLMTSRTEAKGRASAGVHYRRMFILLLFGLAHAYLIWLGDILYTYAMCGFVLYLLRRLKPHWLIVLALISLSIGGGLTLLSGWGITMQGVDSEGYRQTALEFAPPPDEQQAELDAYRAGWIDQFMHRFPEALAFQTFIFIFFVGWRAGGMMLLGMALFKYGVFSAQRSFMFYAGLMILGYAIGLPLIVHEINLHRDCDWDPIPSFFLISGWNYVGSIFVALGHVALVILVCKLGIIRWLQTSLAAVGQMALTNYLLHSIICTFIFYGGWGLGYYGYLERWQQAILVLSIWVFQLIASPLWMKAFRFGPFEWLWRSLTYFKLQPMRRPSTVHA